MPVFVKQAEINPLIKDIDKDINNIQAFTAHLALKVDPIKAQPFIVAPDNALKYTKTTHKYLMEEIYKQLESESKGLGNISGRMPVIIAGGILFLIIRTVLQSFSINPLLALLGIIIVIAVISMFTENKRSWWSENDMP